MSFVVFLYNFIRSWISGPPAPADPWGARTLEWQIPSPPPHDNFDVLPVVLNDPYGYGEPDSPHAEFPDPEREFTTEGAS